MATYRTCKFCGSTAGIAHQCKCGNNKYWYGGTCSSWVEEKMPEFKIKNNDL